MKTGGFRRHSRQIRMKQSTNDESLICDAASALMKELADRLFDEGEVLRLIGVGVRTGSRRIPADGNGRLAAGERTKPAEEGEEEKAG